MHSDRQKTTSYVLESIILSIAGSQLSSRRDIELIGHGIVQKFVHKPIRSGQLLEKKKCTEMEQRLGPNPLNRSNQPIKAKLAHISSDIGTHRPKKARIPCIYVPCLFARFWLRNVLRRTTAVAPTLRIDYSGV